jgi:HK97 family phage major capsid protein
MTATRMAALQSQIEARQAEIDALATADDITPEQDALLDTLLAEQRSAIDEARTIEARAKAVEELRSAATFIPGAAPQVIRKADMPSVDEVRSLGRSEARSAAMRIIDKADTDLVSDASKEKVEALIGRSTGSFDGHHLAKRLLITESDAYRSAFAKAVAANGSTPAWDQDEVRAMNEFRAAMSLTDANGGFGVPVLIDPTIVVTSGAADVPLLRVARIEAITNDEWKGVSSAGVTWSFDAEATEVSDDSPTLAQPTVKAEKAQGFIAYSIEIGEDYPGFAAEMSRLLDEGYRDLLANATAVGSGTNAPTGIFTALDANTNVEVVVTTDGAFGAVDLDKVWAALPERYRRNASWFMNVDVENEIRAFGSGTATSRFTVDQTREGISLLNGKPVLTSDYAPTFTGTTGAANILVVGDFSNYLVAQRVGMSVQLVPFLFGTTNNRPTGQRGWYAYARVGADSINDLGFRILQNT